MKTFYRMLVLLALAFAGACSFSAPAKAQACQWNYSLVGNIATATYCGNVSVAGSISSLSGSISGVANVATLLTIPASFALTTPSLYVAGYYSAGDGICPSMVNWNSTSTATPDNGAVFNPTGHSGPGRWIRDFGPGSQPSINCWGAAPTVVDNGPAIAAAASYANGQGTPVLLTAAIGGSYTIGAGATLPIVFNENAVGIYSAQPITFQFNTKSEGMVGYGIRKIFNNVTWANSNQTSRADATFTGTGSGTNLTVASITGTILIGDRVDKFGSGCAPIGTYITSQSSGPTGGNGVYVTSNAITCSSAAMTAGHYQAVLDLVNAPYSVITNYRTFSNGQYYGGILAQQIYNKGYSWEDPTYDAYILCHIGNWYSHFMDGQTIYDTVGANVGFGIGIYTDRSAIGVVNPPEPPCVAPGTYNGSSIANTISNVDSESMDADILLDRAVSTRIEGGNLLGGNYGIQFLNNSQDNQSWGVYIDQPATLAVYEDGSSDSNLYQDILSFPGNPTPWSIGTINPKSKNVYAGNNSTSQSYFWNRNGPISVPASGTTPITLPNQRASYLIDVQSNQTPTTDYIAFASYNGVSVTGLGNNIGPAGANITLTDTGGGIINITNTSGGTAQINWSVLMVGSTQN